MGGGRLQAPAAHLPQGAAATKPPKKSISWVPPPIDVVMTAQLQHMDWLSGRVPDGVRVQIRKLIEILGYLPHVQPLGVVTADAVLLAANRPLLDLLGAVGDELLGLDWPDLMPGWEQRALDWEREEEPRTHTFEDYVCAAAGERCWVHVVASPVLTDGGPSVADARGGAPALAAWTLFISDRTPHRRSDEDRRRGEVLDLLLESPGEFTMKLDRDWCFEFVSPSLCRALGVRAADLLGRRIDTQHDGISGYEGELGDLWGELARPPFRAEREMAMRTAGDVRSVAWTFEALIEDGGAVRGVFGLGRDVTERRRAEDSVQRRLELETMLAEISSRLTNANTRTLDAEVAFALSCLGRGTGVDAVSLHELGADGQHISGRSVWRAEGVETGTDVTSLADVPWLRDRLRACEMVTVGDVADLAPEAAAERALWQGMGARSVVVAPLSLDGRLYGYLTLLTSAERRDWGEDDLHVLRVLADQFAGEIVWARDARNLELVSGAFLAFGPDCTKNLEAVCAAAGEVTGADFVLYSRLGGDDIELVASWHAPPDLPVVTGASGKVCYDVLKRDEDDVRILSDLQDTVYAHSSPIVRTLGLRSFAGYPVRAGGEPLASLCAFFAADVELRSGQVELLRVLGRAAAVEESRRLAEEERVRGLAQLELAMERTVATLSGALGARDPYTTGHEARVAALATAMGVEMGLSVDELRLLSLAATVHDIGKIVVPAEFLSKPTRLSEAEFAVIQRHSEAGYDLLRPAALPASVMDAVLQHHERLDGSGYPQGLSGDAIGVFGRILAVADVAEAMSSDRPYRPALGVEPALAEIERGRGTLFDPDACDACLSLFREQEFGFVQ